VIKSINPAQLDTKKKGQISVVVIKRGAIYLRVSISTRPLGGKAKYGRTGVWPQTISLQSA
jgi:hypothetical protein